MNSQLVPVFHVKHGYYTRLRPPDWQNRNSHMYTPVTKWTTFTNASERPELLASVLTMGGGSRIRSTTCLVGAEWYPDCANLPYVQPEMKQSATRVSRRDEGRKGGDGRERET